jgi:hypothetical protein
MATKFSEKFGLEGDRVKLAAGNGKFNITHIVLKESKKDYTTRSADNKEKIGKITIAHIDGVSTVDGSIVKYYAPNAPIVQSCKDILDADGTKDAKGKLKEPIFIEEVAEAGEKGREYLYFK